MSSHHRDEIIRAALEAIETGESVHQALADAVDSALEYASLNAVILPDSPMRNFLTDEELRELTFNIATRRQQAPSPLPSGKHKTSNWWELGR